MLFRSDTVEFHPNHHRIMQAAIENGVAGLSWADAAPGAHVARAALCYLHNQAEPGTSCQLTLTHAAVPVLHQAPAPPPWADQVAARPHRTEERRGRQEGIRTVSNRWS